MNADEGAEVRAQCAAWIQALPKEFWSLSAADMGYVLPPEVGKALDLALKLGLPQGDPAAIPLDVGYRAGLAAAAATIRTGGPRCSARRS